MALLIKGGEIVTAETRYHSDILTENDVIRAIGRDLPAPPDAEIVDAAGAGTSQNRIRTRRVKISEASVGSAHEAVRAEVAATRKLFEQHDWPAIDVSRRSIEETAASVINLMTERAEQQA